MTNPAEPNTPTFEIDTHELPPEKRYRTQWGDLSHYVEVRSSDGMVAPIVHAPSQEKAEFAAAALQRWADADPVGFDCANWEVRTHRPHQPDIEQPWNDSPTIDPGQALDVIRQAINRLSAADRDSVLRQLKSQYTTTTERSLYRERAVLLAHIATVHPAALSYTDTAEPRPVLTWYPGGHEQRQVTHHIDPEDLDLFEHVDRREPHDEFVCWDGHTKTEALRRIQESTHEQAAQKGMIV